MLEYTEKIKKKSYSNFETVKNIVFEVLSLRSTKQAQCIIVPCKRRHDISLKNENYA